MRLHGYAQPLTEIAFRLRSIGMTRPKPTLHLFGRISWGKMNLNGPVIWNLSDLMFDQMAICLGRSLGADTAR